MPESILNARLRTFNNEAKNGKFNHKKAEIIFDMINDWVVQLKDDGVEDFSYMQEIDEIMEFKNQVKNIITYNDIVVKKIEEKISKKEIKQENLKRAIIQQRIRIKSLREEIAANEENKLLVARNKRRIKQLNESIAERQLQIKAIEEEIYEKNGDIDDIHDTDVHLEDSLNELNEKLTT
jgi:chromosome segregation ATPase